MEDRRRRNSNSQLLQELDALSHTLYNPNTTRRTTSLALPRSAAPSVDAPVLPSAAAATNPNQAAADGDNHRPRSRRMSMSPFRTRPKSHNEEDAGGDHLRHSLSIAASANEEKKGIWGWRPMRALAHMGMQRLGCLFSVEVVAAQGLPASMNGLRLCVSVRKKETKDGAVQTMPARVLDGAADFEETLFVRCHVYCSGKPIKYEPRPFVISAAAIDAPELDFGRSSVDLSLMVKESVDKSSQGARIRQWDAAFPLAGKARGGELVVKLGFQIMEDGGIDIFKQEESPATKPSSSKAGTNTARGQSKTSFSVSSPRVTRPGPAMTPSTSKNNAIMDLKGMDDFNLDEPAPSHPAPPPPSTSASYQKFEAIEQKPADDTELPDFEVIDKGVEMQQEETKEDKEEEAEATEWESATADEVSATSEVVKEVVTDSAHLMRLTELDSIAMQIKALESMVAGDEDETDDPSAKEGDGNHQHLDAEEENVTREFLHMLELEDTISDLNPDASTGLFSPVLSTPAAEQVSDGDQEAKCFLSDLGKGLSSVVQTRNGGYLAALNPFDTEVARKETPKLAMQISRPVILQDQTLGAGIELLQKLAAAGLEELGSKLASLMPMDELAGKTAEQIAFEGIASAVISGRSKEGASSSAAKSVAALKTMSSAMSEGRMERIRTGIWNVREEPVPVDEVLAFSLQKIEAMAVEALKIQAEMVDEKPPFEVSPLVGKDGSPLDSTISPEDWARMSKGTASLVTMLVLVQMRDPLRRYETVGAPMMAVVQAVGAEDGKGDDEGRVKVMSLHVGGMRMRSGGAKRSGWDGEKQRLTAMQWLVAYGLGKAGKRSKNAKVKGGPDTLWSISSRVMADMWLKPMRNPDIKFPESQR